MSTLELGARTHILWGTGNGDRGMGRKRKSVYFIQTFEHSNISYFLSTATANH